MIHTQRTLPKVTIGHPPGPDGFGGRFFDVQALADSAVPYLRRSQSFDAPHSARARKRQWALCLFMGLPLLAILMLLPFVYNLFEQDRSSAPQPNVYIDAPAGPRQNAAADSLPAEAFPSGMPAASYDFEYEIPGFAGDTQSLWSRGRLIAWQVERYPVRDPKWLTETNPSHYTIQLVGSRNIERLMQFARGHLDTLASSPIFIHQTVFENEPWFTLFTGDFANYSEATRAIDTLPQALRENQPWVRQVQQVMDSPKTLASRTN